MPRVVVVGAGIAGLSTAWFLRRLASEDLRLEVVVLEEGTRVGGKLATLREDGYVFERGAHALLDNEPDTRTLIDELGLSPRLIEAEGAHAKRFVLYRGALRALPSSLPAFLATGLLTARAKLRLLREPWVERAEKFDESIAEFARRRLGAGVLPGLLEPFVTGVFAGDVERLSVMSALPKIHSLEERHGSLVRGMLAARRERLARGEPRRRTRLISFETGLGELPEAIAASLGDRLRLGVRIEKLAERPTGYLLELAGGETLSADAVVLAIPADAARALVERFDPDLASNLGLIHSAPVAAICLAYRREQVAHRLDGFGFLCARGEQRPILGAIFASTIFPRHAPAGMVSLRVLVGGAHQPEIALRPPAELVELARGEMERILGARGGPERSHVFAYPRAIPQYVLGHQARLAAIDGKLRFHPRLNVTGASYRGVSVNDCVRNGRRAAQSVLSYLLNV